jgi:hypothetical protein
MFLLAPATRFGYFIYPAGILAWLIVAAIGQRGVAAEEEVMPPPGPAGAVMARRLLPGPGNELPGSGAKSDVTSGPVKAPESAAL